MKKCGIGVLVCLYFYFNDNSTKDSVTMVSKQLYASSFIRTHSEHKLVSVCLRYLCV
jgi:hypothetical protein